MRSEQTQGFAPYTGRTMLKHIFITASLSACFLLIIGGYQAYSSTLPLAPQSANVKLTPVQTEFMQQVKRVAAPLAQDPLKTIDEVDTLCPTIRSGADVAYKPMLINALSTSRFALARGEAEIIAAAARHTICKVG